MPHHAKAVRMSHAWVAECQDCKWLGGDQGDEASAARDAEMHERGESHPWEASEIVPWNSKSRTYHLRED